MNINYYRKANIQGYSESWQSCQITADTDLSALISEPLVTINGQPILRQHHVTYLTGRETCRAHHFAKHLAVQVIQQPAEHDRCKVLWIDTVHNPHAAATIFRELAQRAPGSKDLHYVCLDVLGSKREDFYSLANAIMALIKEHNPRLVVIDDIDHFLPYCGINTATDFCHSVRDVINHDDTAFLFIGYNHLGKKASTTGNLGKHLFLNADDIFSVSTVRDITTVRHVYGYDLRCDPDSSEYRFTIGPDNFPQEASTLPVAKQSHIDDDTLRDIADGILTPGQDITADEFVRQVGIQRNLQRRQERDTAIINQALRLNLIIPAGNDKYTAPNICDNPLITKEIKQEINTSLTLPPHPNSATTPTASPDKHA